MKRFPFLDWMRGVAVLIMFQCHTFNSFTREDLRHNGAYIFTQWVGGMAAPLFLFMAGMTFGFQMESLDRREPRPFPRWLHALRRAGYILAVAFLFRFSNWLASLPSPSLQELMKVDILNCMALAMAAFSLAALVGSEQRLRVLLFGGVAVAALAPIMSGLDWTAAPPLVRDYLVPSPLKGRFPFFPCAAYLGFGAAAGLIVKRSAAALDRLMQWSVLAGFGLVFTSLYFADLPFSLYAHSDFWRNSPALIFIRVGITLLLMAGAYLWTEFCARGWSWIQTLGKASLLVYWVHVMLVYGDIARVLKRALTVPEAAAATLGVTLLMLALAHARLQWKARRAARSKSSGVPAPPELVGVG
ncbi:MAG TPA: acyltransferase family protein [Bryobacteraceae bacterium]|nr:acyltransferase family protein [Bryobacteraceae bacterium]